MKQKSGSTRTVSRKYRCEGCGKWFLNQDPVYRYRACIAYLGKPRGRTPKEVEKNVVYCEFVYCARCGV